MRRLPILFGAIACLVALAAPSAAMAHTSLMSSVEATTPTPTPRPTGPPKAPSAGGSTTAKDALTIVGFSIITMAGLILVIRAGLRSANAEDDD